MLSPSFSFSLFLTHILLLLLLLLLLLSSASFRTVFTWFSTYAAKCCTLSHLTPKGREWEKEKEKEREKENEREREIEKKKMYNRIDAISDEKHGIGFDSLLFGTEFDSGRLVRVGTLLQSMCFYSFSYGSIYRADYFLFSRGKGEGGGFIEILPSPPPLLGCMSRDQVGIVPISWISVRLIPIRNSIRSGSLRFWDGNTPRFFGIFGDSLASTGSEDLWVKLLMVGGGERGG